MGSRSKKQPKDKSSDRSKGQKTPSERKKHFEDLKNKAVSDDTVSTQSSAQGTQITPPSAASVDAGGGDRDRVNVSQCSEKTFKFNWLNSVALVVSVVTAFLVFGRYQERVDTVVKQAEKSSSSIEGLKIETSDLSEKLTELKVRITQLQNIPNDISGLQVELYPSRMKIRHECL